MILKLLWKCDKWFYSCFTWSFVGQMLRLMAEVLIHFVAMGRSIWQDTLMLKSCTVKQAGLVMCHYYVWYTSLLVSAQYEQRSKEKKTITSFPSMPRRRVCAWCHNKYIYGYWEEFLPPLLHCINRDETWRKASSFRKRCNIVTPNEPDQTLGKTAKWAPRTEPAPVRKEKRINEHRCQRISPLQTFKGSHEKKATTFWLIHVASKMLGNKSPRTLWRLSFCRVPFKRIGMKHLRETRRSNRQLLCSWWYFRVQNNEYEAQIACYSHILSKLTITLGYHCSTLAVWLLSAGILDLAQKGIS